MRHPIQPNFSIPWDYERLFMLCNNHGWKYIIGVDRYGIHSGEIGGPPTPEEQSICLDWIAEVICSVRYECENL